MSFRFFNDVFDTGVRDERLLKIINFFVVFHFLLFPCLFVYAIKQACRKQEDSFGKEVGKMKRQVDADDQLNSKKHN